MKRGKYDTCENFINYNEKRIICRLDNKDVDEDNWCKHHKSEDEEDEED